MPIDKKTFPTFKPNPLFASLPAYLKTPEAYDKIQKAVYETIATTCSHSDVYEMAACMKCSNKMLERRRLLKSLGFSGPAQYMGWRKVHEQLRDISRVKLSKYND